MDSVDIRSGQLDVMGCLLQIFVLTGIVVVIIILLIGIGVGLLIAGSV